MRPDLAQVAATAPPTGPETAAALHLETALDSRLHLTGLGPGGSVRFLLDTGAAITVLTPADAALLGTRETERTRVRVVGGDVGATVGMVPELAIGGLHLRAVRVLVVDGQTQSLVGMDVISQLGDVRIIPEA